MNLDIKKTHPTPKNGFEASDFMIKAQSHLIDALFIMNSCIKYTEDGMDEIHKKRMADFIKRFET